MTRISNKKMAIALALLGAGLLALRALCHWQQGVDALLRWVVHPYQRAVGWLCSFVPFSVAELLWVCFLLFCVWYGVKAVADIFKSKGLRLRMAAHKMLGAVGLALSVAVSATLLWGVQYYATPFETQIGMSVQPISVQQLAQVTQLFANRVNATATGMPRNENGVMTLDVETVFDAAQGMYDALEAAYPSLYIPRRIQPKPMLFSRLMSEINYTGFFFPYTGEANLNAQQPLCFLPSTIAHEMAHVRGIAPEQTANFVAVLACESSDSPVYEYSGALLGYLHLSNALYSADAQRWVQVNETLCVEGKADLRENTLYWQQYESVAATAADAVYESFLQSYDQTLGLKSYGAVVDLLVAYYGKEGV